MLTLLLTLVDTLGVVITLSALIINLSLVFLALRGADLLSRLVGVTALRAFSRVNALLLAAFAVNLIRRGWQSQL
jgi:multiple antibiotic resistance protein